MEAQDDYFVNLFTPLYKILSFNIITGFNKQIWKQK